MSTETNKILGVDLDFSFVIMYLHKILERILHKDRSLLKILLASAGKSLGYYGNPGSLSNMSGMSRYRMRRITFHSETSRECYEKEP